MKIAKAFEFDAAHHLPAMPEGHRCKRLHGHTYRVELILDGEPDENGIVVDYDAIAVVWDPIHTLLDHRLLNEIPGLENPTTENLARLILRLLVNGVEAMPFVAVRVYESSSTWCEVSR